MERGGIAMERVNLDEITLDNAFSEMSEECQIATEGGCGGGSVASGVSFPTKLGWIQW